MLLLPPCGEFMLRGDTLIFLSIRRLSPIFGVSKFWFFSYFHMNEYFWEYEDIVDICL